jgi:hypothetical protein
LVIAVHLWVALPLKTELTPRSLDNPIAQEELQHWADRLSDWGVDMTAAELESKVIEKGGAVGAFRSATLKPLRPTMRITGTGQAWGLFTYPNTYPHRLEVTVLGDQGWQLIYRALDPEYDWRAQTFTYRRVRGVYDDSAFQKARSYEHFCETVAQWAHDDFPDVSVVRLSMTKSHVTLPGEPVDPVTEERLIRLCTPEADAWTCVEVDP